MRERKLHLLKMGHIYENMAYAKEDPLYQNCESIKKGLIQEFRRSIFSNHKPNLPAKIHRSLIMSMFEDSPSKGARQLGIPRTTHLDRVKRGQDLLRREANIREIWKQYVEIGFAQAEIMSFHDNLEAHTIQSLRKGST
jgi:hypothetical protein